MSTIPAEAIKRLMMKNAMSENSYEDFQKIWLGPIGDRPRFTVDEDCYVAMFWFEAGIAAQKTKDLAAVEAVDENAIAATATIKDGDDLSSFLNGAMAAIDIIRQRINSTD